MLPSEHEDVHCIKEQAVHVMSHSSLSRHRGITGSLDLNLVILADCYSKYIVRTPGQKDPMGWGILSTCHLLEHSSKMFAVP